VAFAAGFAPFGALPAALGLVAFSLAARDARPGRLTLGIRIRGISGTAPV
jgi:hypothetical protein